MLLESPGVDDPHYVAEWVQELSPAVEMSQLKLACLAGLA